MSFTAVGSSASTREATARRILFLQDSQARDGLDSTVRLINSITDRGRATDYNPGHSVPPPVLELPAWRALDGAGPRGRANTEISHATTTVSLPLSAQGCMHTSGSIGCFCKKAAPVTLRCWCTMFGDCDLHTEELSRRRRLLTPLDARPPSPALS
ncbi:hypothetical protein LMH87_010640 [Akanthomyces muscarius]|uniref:Uncharacterized protein n=1 Tax=Akanthomyces muscarius TaxID=2231603 RepID=A0A9W8UKP9_AKAMU|nr:hypothetical protein LMH87_010640 [Akanthomyces muscarius]KAJ4154179.1 hypothetical protein LMH87_010640 [Akanthomyces muscarius]